jgi:Tfp pilus assembly protein PilO
MKTFTSIILIIAGAVLFIFFTRPKFAELQENQLRVKALNVATANAKNLETKKGALLDIRKNISAEDINKLDTMLPNNVENVKLIIDFDKMLQSMVEERGTLRLYKSTEVTNTGSKKISIENPKITPGVVSETDYDTSRLGAINFSFSVTLTYSDFLEFLRRIEHSTRILDVESISFSVASDQGDANSDDPIYTFNITLKTYWLKYISDNKLQ